MNIVIIGRRWFNKKQGNTYHTSEIIIDGKCHHKTEREYGYGCQYEQTWLDWLEKQGFINRERWENGSYEMGWAWAQRTGNTFYSIVTDVARKADL